MCNSETGSKEHLDVTTACDSQDVAQVLHLPRRDPGKTLNLKPLNPKP